MPLVMLLIISTFILSLWMYSNKNCQNNHKYYKSNIINYFIINNQ